MNYKLIALGVLGTFALGVAAGRISGTTDAQPPAATQAITASLPARHPPLGDRGLADAVQMTLRASSGTALVGFANPGAAMNDKAARADELRRQRHFEDAARLYAELAAAGPMSADNWADYADALASASSTLRGEPEKALDQALRLDPRHPKALWLKASLQHEEHQYASAVRTWETLLALVPRDSSDANIIRANIAEATRLASSRS